jgi:hypothetical protein
MMQDISVPADLPTASTTIRVCVVEHTNVNSPHCHNKGASDTSIDMRHCVFLLVFCCFGLLYGSLAASQDLDTPVLASQVGPTSVRNSSKAAERSLSVSSHWDNRSITDSLHYLKSRIFGASTVQTYPSEPVGDLPLQPSVPHQTASSSENRLSSVRKAAEDKVASLPLVATRSSVVGPMPVDMHQPPSVAPIVKVPAPVPMTRREGEATEPPSAIATKPQQWSCPPSTDCEGKNLMYKQVSATCQVACVLESNVAIKRKAGWACGSCSS